MMSNGQQVKLLLVTMLLLQRVLQHVIHVTDIMRAE